MVVRRGRGLCFPVFNLLVGLLWLVARSAWAAPRTPQPPWPEPALAIYGFDSALARVPWRNVALNEEESLVESWSGYALVREGFVATPVIIPLETDSKRSNYKADAGAIRFWIAPCWTTASEKSEGKGPGHVAQLLQLVQLRGEKLAGRWALCVNETGDVLYWVTEQNGKPVVRLKAKVQFTAGDWRMVTLGYSPTNTALWIDGEFQATGEGFGKLSEWEQSDLGLVIGSDLIAGPDNVADAQFEELTLLPRWPKKSDFHDLYFKSGKRRSWLGPLGTKEEERAKVNVLQAEGLIPEEESVAAKSMNLAGGMEALSYAAGTLWLEITGVTNGQAQLIVHGTTADVAYEILSKADLTNSAWAGELPIVVGASGQDWTATTVALGSRTNQLFFWARTLVDTDGDGLPDWWELAHGLDPNSADTGNTGVADGYRDADNDGWTNLQEYQNGTSPAQFNTPAATAGLLVATDTTGTHAKLNWLSGNGPVTGYTIQRASDNSTVGVSSGVSFTDLQTNLPSGLYFESAIPSYRVRAEYGGGSGAWSEWQTTADLKPVVAQFIIPQDGNAVVVLPKLPAATTAVRLGIGNFYYNIFDVESVESFDIPATQITNGVALMPSGYAAIANSNGNYFRYVQAILTNGAVTAIDWWGWDMNYLSSFWDARSQLKDNLRFMLRAASPYQPLEFWLNNVSSGHSDDYAWSPENYAFSSYFNLREFFPDSTWALEDPLIPFYENYLYKNLVYDFAVAAAAGSEFGTGAQWANGLTIDMPPLYSFTPPSAPATLSSVLATNSTTWLGGTTDIPLIEYQYFFEDLGISVYSNNNAFHYNLSPGFRNRFGLEYKAMLFTYGSPITAGILQSEGELVLPNDQIPGLYFPQVEEPQFTLAEYYFGSFTHKSFSDAFPPLPGQTEFSNTNISPLLIVPFGKLDYKLFGYAKLAIANAYNDVYGYLGQYFDNALLTTNGITTTNQTGIISRYGDFIPTEPGRIAVLTLPDLDTGERGTAIVHVVKLQLDANHDGVMNLSLFGPDNTSPSKPFTFWVNNDFDSAGLYGDPDQDVNTANRLFDYNYSDGIYGNGKPCIHSKRDLEDYARLWICGMPALATNAGYQVTMSWGSVSSGNPKIHLFQSVETNGGTLYLTDTNVAAAQAAIQTYVPNTNMAYYIPGPGISIGTVSNGGTFTFPASYFTNAGNKYLLFEGAGIGAGELRLTITQNTTNVLAQTSTWLDIRDVSDFFEQAYATNVTSGKPPSSLVSDFGVIRTAVAPLPDETEQIIVFIHGINNTVSDYETTTRTIFKRLYWAGYHGRVASFRWPCAYLPPTTANPFLYNLGEFYAFKSATALKNYLSYLRNNRPDLAGYDIDLYAHSQGNVVTSEAILQGAPFDNYILTQGAFPAHCYDTNAPFLQKLLDAETNSVNATQTPFYTTNGGYHGYCLPIQGNLINFYNTNDYALATGTTLGLQTNWEEDQRAQKPEAFFGGPSYIYDPVTGITTGYYTFSSSYTVTDLQEIKALVARSRSKAVGAQGGLHGAIDSSVDLFTSYGFWNTRPEHSAQFARPIQTCLPYYRQMMTSFQILP